MEKLKKLVDEFNRAIGDERFYLAQAIAAVASPRVQEELDIVRTEIMACLSEGLALCAKHKVENCICIFKKTVVAPKRMANHGTKKEWLKHQVTPEVSHDLSLTGKKLPKSLSKRLSLVLRAQQNVVYKAVRILGG